MPRVGQGPQAVDGDHGQVDRTSQQDVAVVLALQEVGEAVQKLKSRRRSPRVEQRFRSGLVWSALKGCIEERPQLGPLGSIDCGYASHEVIEC